MSELQNEEVTIEEDSADIENQEIGSELAADSEAGHEDKPQVDEEAVKQEAIQKAINEKVFKQKQAERERDQYKAQLEEYERKQREEQAKLYQSVPPMPDSFDDDFDLKIAERDRVIAQKAQYDWEQQSFAKQQQSQHEQAQRAKAEEIHAKAATYNTRSTELGIKQEELQAAGNKVAQYGLTDDLVLHILSENDGPLITKYLAANPNDGYELANMSPYKQGVFLNEIKAKAAALKPKTTNTPNPATNLQGNGADPELGKYKHIKGVKYE